MKSALSVFLLVLGMSTAAFASSSTLTCKAEDTGSSSPQVGEMTFSIASGSALKSPQVQSIDFATTPSNGNTAVVSRLFDEAASNRGGVIITACSQNVNSADTTSSGSAPTVALLSVCSSQVGSQVTLSVSVKSDGTGLFEFLNMDPADFTDRKIQLTDCK